MQNKFWQNKLEPGETIEREFTLGTIYLRYSLIISIVFSVIILFFFIRIGFIVLTLALFYNLFYIKRANQFAFTNKRILVMRGWLTTQLTSIDYEKITDIHIRQDFLEKASYKTGSILIETAGSIGQIVLKNIEDPYGLKKELDTIRSKRTEYNISNKSNTLTNLKHTSYYKELYELVDLKEKGIISQNEFDAKKKQILNI